MLRSLGVYTVLKWFALACIAVAVWQSFNGNLAEIARAAGHFIQMGADVVKDLWAQIQSHRK